MYTAAVQAIQLQVPRRCSEAPAGAARHRVPARERPQRGWACNVVAPLRRHEATPVPVAWAVPPREWMHA